MADFTPHDSFEDLIAALGRKDEELTLDHYPQFLELHCRSCYVKTDHTFEGMEQVVQRRPRRIPRRRIVSYRCDLCKFSADYWYSPPNQKLEFKEARKRNDE